MPSLDKSKLSPTLGILNKSFLPQVVISIKAMSEKEKREELAEIDRLLDELEGEDLFSSIEEDGDTQKAAGHKYVRKYRVGNKWRYVYANKGDRHSKGSQISHSRVIGKDEHLTEGSHFSLGPGKGHMVIESTSGDKITYTIDGKGEKKTVSKAEFKQKVLEAHRPQVEAHAKAGLERREDILQRARKVDPNSKQAARAEKELARWKQEASDFLPKQGEKKTGKPVSEIYDSVFVTVRSAKTIKDLQTAKTQIEELKDAGAESFLVDAAREELRERESQLSVTLSLTELEREIDEKERRREGKARKERAESPKKKNLSAEKRTWPDHEKYSIDDNTFLKAAQIYRVPEAAAREMKSGYRRTLSQLKETLSSASSDRVQSMNMAVDSFEEIASGYKKRYKAYLESKAREKSYILEGSAGFDFEKQKRRGNRTMDLNNEMNAYLKNETERKVRQISSVDTRKAMSQPPELPDEYRSPSSPQESEEAATSTTEEQTQKAAYSLDDRCELDGLKVSIENDAGSTRKGTDPDGKEWATAMKSPYGYIRGTKGVDGDHLDVFLGPEAQKVRKGDEGDLSKVYIVHAKDPQSGKYDEDKCMLGYASKADAVEDFKRHYDNPEKFLGPVSEMSWDTFKKRIADTSENPRRLGRGSMFVGKETAKACGYTEESQKAEESEEDDAGVEVEEAQKAMESEQGELDSMVEEVEKALKACYADTQKAPAKYSHIDFTPPESVQEEAERGLEMRKEASPSNRGGLTPEEAGKQGIGSGVSRASQLKRGTAVSPDVIGMMVNFFNRHEAYKHKHKSDPGGKAQQSWKLWGGNAGRSWANKIKRQMDAADKKGDA